MDIILIAGLATACVLTAVEGLLTPLGKWRGLLALSLATAGCFNLGAPLSQMITHVLAAAFVGLTLSIAVEQVFSGISVRQARGLPNRVDKL
jgi:hypothetical protein